MSNISVDRTIEQEVEFIFQDISTFGMRKRKKRQGEGKKKEDKERKKKKTRGRNKNKTRGFRSTSWWMAHTFASTCRNNCRVPGDRR